MGRDAEILHGRTAVAALKSMAAKSATSWKTILHGRTAVAALKSAHYRRDITSEPLTLHGRTAVAALKSSPPGGGGSNPPTSPRPYGRGRIEVWINQKGSPSRDRFSTAVRPWPH